MANGMPNGMRQSSGLSMGEVPRFVSYTSPVLNGPSAGGPLPLNLMARIVGYLDDPGDIARVTRTSRLLYYIAASQLYQKVALHSYAETKYVNGRPEGFGSGSPFVMALNGLVTGKHAQVVQELRIWGEWKELGVEEFAKGRVPDNAMLLNILLRACIDKMVKLQSFTWELDCKPLKTLYQGLASRNTVTSLTLRFPSSRLPGPAVIIPPMPSLLAFRAYDIDPLCYPDDISLLLLGSKQLMDLRLHFTPRVRQEAEPTLSLEKFFGRCFKANYVPKVKHIAMQNWFGPREHGFYTLFDAKATSSMTFLDTFGGATAGPANVYVDDTWRDVPADVALGFRTIRFNEFASHHVEMIRNSSGLEKVYVVSDRKGKSVKTITSPSDEYVTPDESPTAMSAMSPNARGEIEDLGRKYIHAFTHQHGKSLRHLLLSNQWPLSELDVTDLIRRCPNLTQVGFAVGFGNPDMLRFLLPFLQDLTAFRLLDNGFTRMQEDTVTEADMAVNLGRDTMRMGASKVKWAGLGRMLFRIGDGFQATLPDGSLEWRRQVTPVSRQEVEGAGVEIWALDKLDCFVDKGPLG